MSSSAIINGSYDYRLVALSVVLAIFSSYAAVDLAGRVTSAHGGKDYLAVPAQPPWALGFGRCTTSARLP